MTNRSTINLPDTVANIMMIGLSLPTQRRKVCWSSNESTHHCGENHDPGCPTSWRTSCLVNNLPNIMIVQQLTYLPDIMIAQWLSYLPDTVANIMMVFPFLLICSKLSGSLGSSFDRSILGGSLFHSGSSSSSSGSSPSCSEKKEKRCAKKMPTIITFQVWW